MIKTGILSTAYFGFDDFSSGMEKIRAHGYDCIDYQEFARFAESPLYKLTDGEFERYLTEVKACAAENGLEIWQLHGVWPTVDDKTAEGRAKTREYQQKAIAGAQILGCKRVIVHPCMPRGWSNGTKEEFFEKNVEMLSALAPYAEGAGVILCLENMPFKQGETFSTLAEWLAVLDALQSPNVQACLDTGHAACLDTTPYQTVTALGARLAALHVHDDRARQDRHLMPFQGDYDWTGFIQGLKDIGFDGCISLECCVQRQTPQPMKEQMQLALSGIAKWIAESVARK